MDCGVLDRRAVGSVAVPRCLERRPAFGGGLRDVRGESIATEAALVHCPRDPDKCHLHKSGEGISRMNRRGFIGGLAAALAAPSIIRPGVLMPVRSVPHGYIYESTSWRFVSNAHCARSVVPVLFVQIYQSGPLLQEFMKARRSTEGQRILTPSMVGSISSAPASA